MQVLLIIWCITPWLIAASQVLRLAIYSQRNRLFTEPKSYWIGETLRLADARRKIDPEYDHLYLSAKRWAIITLIWWGATFLIVAIFATICIAFFQ